MKKLLMCLLLVTACGSTGSSNSTAVPPAYNSAPAPAPAPVTRKYATEADAIVTVAIAACTRAIACGAQMDLRECAMGFAQSLCNQKDCDSEPHSTDTQLDQCAMDISSMDCAGLQSGDAPASCNGVL